MDAALARLEASARSAPADESAQEAWLRARLRADDDCPIPCADCDGSGSVDSGGFTPWGDSIDVACPECGGSGRAPVIEALYLAALLRHRPSRRIVDKPWCEANPRCSEADREQCWQSHDDPDPRGPPRAPSGRGEDLREFIQRLRRWPQALQRASIAVARDIHNARVKPAYVGDSWPGESCPRRAYCLTCRNRRRIRCGACYGDGKTIKVKRKGRGGKSRCGACAGKGWNRCPSCFGQSGFCLTCAAIRTAEAWESSPSAETVEACRSFIMNNLSTIVHSPAGAMLSGIVHQGVEFGGPLESDREETSARSIAIYATRTTRYLVRGSIERALIAWALG